MVATVVAPAPVYDNISRLRGPCPVSNDRWGGHGEPANFCTCRDVLELFTLQMTTSLSLRLSFEAAPLWQWRHTFTRRHRRRGRPSLSHGNEDFCVDFGVLVLDLRGKHSMVVDSDNHDAARRTTTEQLQIS